MSKRSRGSATEPEYDANLAEIKVFRRSDSVFGKAGDVEDHSGKVINDGKVKIKVSEVEGRSEEVRAFLFTLPMFKEWYDDALRRWGEQKKGD